MKLESSATLVAMSGGVDSSVAAYLMVQNGWDCEGAIALMWGRTGQAKDTHQQNVSDAEAVATRLGIPFHILDASAAFEKAVVCEFIEAYQQGLTPNPCIRCNQHIKFSKLLEAPSCRHLTPVFLLFTLIFAIRSPANGEFGQATRLLYDEWRILSRHFEKFEK